MNSSWIVSVSCTDGSEKQLRPIYSSKEDAEMRVIKVMDWFASFQTLTNWWDRMDNGDDVELRWFYEHDGITVAADRYIKILKYDVRWMQPDDKTSLSNSSLFISS